MRICYDNEVKNATISAFTENPDYLFSDALTDIRVSRVGRTVDVNNEWIKFSFAAAVSASYLIIHSHNISASATIKLQANATDVWTSPSVDLTLTHGEWIVENFTEVSYQYWRVTIDDPTNTDGYLEISKIFLGTYFQTPGPSPDSKLNIKTSSTYTKTPTGQLYPNSKIKLKSWGFSFPITTEAQRQSAITFFNATENTVPFFLLIWESGLDTEPPIYCNQTESQLPLTKIPNQGLLWKYTLKIEECK